jgi:hypothetical protein
MPALVVIGLWIVLRFVSGNGSISNTAKSGGVAYMAHIGGFIAGFVLDPFPSWERGARDNLGGHHCACRPIRSPQGTTTRTPFRSKLSVDRINLECKIIHSYLAFDLAGACC